MDCQYNRKLALACGLVTIPNRRTFDGRLKTISTDIKERISAMGQLFVATEDLVMVDDDFSITTVDSTLLKANGHLWHKSSIEKGIVPCPGIDTDAKWGYSRTKGWVFGYKFHLTSTTTDAAGDLVVPLTADVTTANVQDTQIHVSLTTSSSSSSVFSLPSALYMVADLGYDDRKLYEYSKKMLCCMIIKIL
ncbi:MAG: transposase [Candidatus Nitrosocosmicus sp.]